MMKLFCVALAFAVVSSVILCGCGGNSPDDQLINVKGVIEPNGGQPASEITLELYTNGHVDDANYLAAKTVTSIRDPFEFTVSSEGTYDMLLRFTIVSETWVNDERVFEFLEATRTLEDIVVVGPSTDLGTISVDFPIPW